MGISNRVPSRPTPKRDVLMDAAMTARAHGLLSESALKRLSDGKVSRSDIDNAEAILNRAEELLSDVKGSDSASMQHVRIAEQRVEVAQTLLEAVEHRYDHHAPRRPARPSGHK